jgi:hypothetical protein
MLARILGLFTRRVHRFWGGRRDRPVVDARPNERP